MGIFASKEPASAAACARTMLISKCSPEFPGLTIEEVKECREDGMSNDQIKKRSDRAIEKMNTTLNNRSLPQTEKGYGHDELRLVLLGKTGAGKSATGNLLLGQSEFTESASSTSQTQTIKEGRMEVDGINVRVIDTPGLFDTTKDNLTTVTEIAKVLDTFKDGIHGFLFVFNMGNPRFTQEERDAFDEIEKVFKTTSGPSFLDHCFILLTHPSTKKEWSLSQYLQDEKEQNTPFGNLIIKDVKSKVIAVDNGEHHSYIRDNSRIRIVQLVKNSVSDAYTNEAISKFVIHQKGVADKLPASIRRYAVTMEQILGTKLHGKSDKEIKGLSANSIEDIVNKVYDEMGIQDVPPKDCKDGIRVILKAKMYRLTDEGFLSKIKGFARSILRALGLRR